MPTAAIRTGVVDYVLPIDQIAPKLVQLMTKAA
jgi:chemotaxis response regulator CheB